MRWVIGAVIGLALAPSAFAADLDSWIAPQPAGSWLGPQPVGPATFTRWSGWYFGGQGGYSNVSADLSQATAPLLAFSLRELALEQVDQVSTWPVLSGGSTSGASYGAFGGYNTQWQDLTLGLELGYTHVGVAPTANSTPISRQTSAGGNTYDVTVQGSASLKLIDYASLRARAGYVIGDFLPYGYAGFVLGRANYTLTSLVFGQENPSSPPVVPCNLGLSPTCVDFSFANSNAKTDALLYGFSVGGGVDYAVTQNIFIRGEFEYIRFAPLENIPVAVTSGRLGLGFRF